MDGNQNVEVVKAAYAAFGRGDIDALLGMMTNDVDWQTYGPADLPTTGQRLGKPEVGRFFQQVGATWNFERFEPQQFIAQGDMVVALGIYSGTAKPGGREFSSEFAHVFTVRNGMVTRFREYTDTAMLAGSLAGAMSRA